MCNKQILNLAVGTSTSELQADKSDVSLNRNAEIFLEVRCSVSLVLAFQWLSLRQPVAYTW